LPYLSNSSAGEFWLRSAMIVEQTLNWQQTAVLAMRRYLGRETKFFSLLTVRLVICRVVDRQMSFKSTACEMIQYINL
jgi:hypothetical protein